MSKERIDVDPTTDAVSLAARITGKRITIAHALRQGNFGRRQWRTGDGRGRGGDILYTLTLIAGLALIVNALIAGTVLATIGGVIGTTWVAFNAGLLLWTGILQKWTND